jgi:hypothetical protein
MSKSYVIRWRSKVNGRIGKGSRLFEKQEADSLAAELNEEYPEIEHEVVHAEADTQAETVDEQTKVHALSE